MNLIFADKRFKKNKQKGGNIFSKITALFYVYRLIGANKLLVRSQPPAIL